MLDNNLLSPLGFAFRMKRAPNVEFQVQQVSVPGMNLGAIQSPTPFVRITDPGNITYDDLQITFLVGENLDSYLEIFNWIEQLGRPDNLNQYSYEKTDASLMVLNSAKRAVFDIQFTDIFPTSLSGLDFDSTIADVQYISATATFSFDRFYYNTLG